MTATATATVNTKGLVGQIIGDGRYDLRELLGGGSMGYVYRAFDRRLETDVVVKIPRKHKLQNPDSLRRFRQESKFLVKLNHPHVVSILDVGEYGGVPFFVMPFISGGSLRSRQTNELGIQKPLNPTSLQRWLLAIARALDFIHSQGCVHRDVKPDNILFDEHGHALLSDFGLSKILRADEKDDPSQTAAGAIVGTPLFCAPELVLGAAIDGRADQYSLALTVYDTLAGTNPFEGPNSSATLVNQTAMQPPPLAEFNPGVTPALWRCVLKGLAKSPEQRFGSCVEFAQAVLATVQVSGSSQSSGAHSGPKTSARHSSSSNAVADTSISARKVGGAARGSPVVSASLAHSRPSPGATASKMHYVISARTPIHKARCACPGCSKDLALQPAFAGKKATCQTCGCRLMISTDFSELRKLDLVPAQDEVAASSISGRDSNVSGAPSLASPGEFDLVLGQEVFGWKLSRRLALGLAGGLIVLLLLLTAYFTNLASRVDQDLLREQLRPRSVE